MIVVIANWEKDARGTSSLITSHGVDKDTMRDVILPCVHPRELGAKFDEILREWVIS